ncbi:MAG: hypothetical protein LUQ35_05225, partial [Methanoregula sp.]|nr:hypothetical protein [Methanoregula sp.]
GPVTVPVIFPAMAIRGEMPCNVPCRRTIAEAIRGARLKVLSSYNPLGLVYNPFISGGIRLGEGSARAPPR